MRATSFSVFNCKVFLPSLNKVIFRFSVMQSTFCFSNVEILAVPTTSLIYNI